MTQSTTRKSAARSDHLNSLVIRGRVSSLPAERVLPSGDPLMSFRVVVERSARARRRSRAKVDVFDCVIWTATGRRAVRSLRIDDVVEVRGEVHRRFHRSGGAPVSRYDVEVVSCRRIKREDGRLSDR